MTRTLDRKREREREQEREREREGEREKELCVNRHKQSLAKEKRMLQLQMNILAGFLMFGL